VVLGEGAWTVRLAAGGETPTFWKIALEVVTDGI